MKKFYLLCAAACAVASVSAVEKEAMAASKQLTPTLEKVSAPKLNFESKAKAAELKKAAAATRAGEVEYTFYRPADQLMSISSTSKGYNLSAEYGFGSSYGTADFINFSTGASSYVWNFSEINDFEGNDFNVKTSSSVDLSVKAAVGEMMVPWLDATYASGATDYYVQDKECYILGASAQQWFNTGDVEQYGVAGATFYQNQGMVNPEGYNGQLNIVDTYYPGNRNFNENGVFSSWTEDFQEELGVPVSNVTLNAYYIHQPKPTSTYFFTTGWLWVSMEASADTQLISYVYPVDEAGEMAEMPVAIGYASVPRGETSYLQFYYYPLNEDGDELEGEVFIDSAVMISVEGFTGNSAISYLSPIAGFYPFPLDAYRAGNYELWKDPDLYLDFSLTANGDVYNIVTYDPSGYYFDQRDTPAADRNTISPMCYCIFATDATYAFIHSVDGSDEVSLPLEGGNASLEITALYYNINQWLDEGVYELTAPEWLSVSFGESSYETGNTLMTVSAAPTEVARTGVVTLEGIGAKFSLTVNQGDGNAVSSIVLDKNAEYFDLQGRKVANPEKGLYIKKAGNKAEKVIL